MSAIVDIIKQIVEAIKKYKISVINFCDRCRTTPQAYVLYVVLYPVFLFWRDTVKKSNFQC